MRTGGLKVAAWGRRGRQDAPHADKKCPKVPIWRTLGGTNPPKIVFYNWKTLIFAKSTNPHFSQLLAPFVLQGVTKVVQKVARGRPRVRPGEPPGPQGCQKVSKKVTKNVQKWHHLATPRPKAVPGRPREPFGVPPSWQSVQKRKKNDHMKRRFFWHSLLLSCFGVRTF